MVESQKVQNKKKSFFDSSAKEERRFFFQYTSRSILVLTVAIIGCFSLYWGSYFQREQRLGNLNAYIYNYDEPANITTLSRGVVGEALIKSLPENSLTWQVFNSSSNNQEFSIEQIKSQIKEEDAWVAVIVPSDATKNLYSAMKSADYQLNSTGPAVIIYESERDLTTFNYILPELNRLQHTLKELAPETVYKPLLEQLGDREFENLVSKAPNVLTNPLQPLHIDLSTYKAAILVAPLQVGLIFLVMLSIYQFNFFAALNQRLATKLSFKTLVFIRIFIAYTTYFAASLSVSLVSLAFQVKFGSAGHFVSYWMTSFIAISALGNFLELAAMLINPIHPPYMMLVFMFWGLCNISPAFSAIELCPGFYKYGYGLPVYNALSAMRIFVVGTTRRHLGRNIGVLIAWNAVEMLLLPVVMRLHFKLVNRGKKNGKA